LSARVLAWLLRWQRQLLAAAALMLVLLLVRVYLFKAHIDGPLLLQSAQVLQVDKGASLTRVLLDLEADGILQGANDVLLYARFTELGTRMQAGEYELVAGLTARGLLALLESGKVIHHQVSIIEGWTLRQALQAIQSHPAITVTLPADDPQALKDAFGTEHYPEGWVFPDTYNFTRGTTDVELLLRARKVMEQTLALSWAGREVGLPYGSPTAALILASIIEKETAKRDEQSQIAGVFVRRLRQNMRLQTDPTVIYGLGDEFDGNLTRAHLQADTPWNTYTRAGLPLTPIALPGLGAIEAVMHPAEGDALYFVARGDGSHYFSATLEEHNQAVRQYQLGEAAP
jgi:UPF0755 protein